LDGRLPRQRIHCRSLRDDLGGLPADCTIDPVEYLLSFPFSSQYLRGYCRFIHCIAHDYLHRGEN
jgi:hypothetical protein